MLLAEGHGRDEGRDSNLVLWFHTRPFHSFFSQSDDSPNLHPNCVTYSFFPLNIMRFCKTTSTSPQTFNRIIVLNVSAGCRRPSVARGSVYQPMTSQKPHISANHLRTTDKDQKSQLTFAPSTYLIEVKENILLCGRIY